MISIGGICDRCGKPFVANHERTMCGKCDPVDHMDEMRARRKTRRSGWGKR